MGQVLVRNLATEVVRKLKIRAQQHRRSLQEELKDILEQAAPDAMFRKNGFRSPRAEHAPPHGGPQSPGQILRRLVVRNQPAFRSGQRRKAEQKTADPSQL